MAKGKSFADKAKKSKKSADFTNVKYVKSIVSEKTGQYRFQESMVKVPTGMTLANYLKQVHEPTVRNKEEDKPSE